jgi:predicted peptidase
MTFRIFLFLMLPLFLISAIGCSSPTRIKTGRETVSTTETLEYYLYFPPEYDKMAEAKFPLLLFLHGGGESGGDLDLIRENGPPKLLAEGKEFPFLILAPQNPHKKQWWNVRAVLKLLERITSEYRIDPDRLYLTGLSRGGNACWEIATQFPDTFAAMAVVCAMSPVPYAHWINKSMPIWVFHGTEDPVIPFSESQEMVLKLKEMGYDVRFTAYEGIGHNSWEKAYLEEGLYEWFLKYSK